MLDWIENLNYNPLEPLVNCNNIAIRLNVDKYLLNKQIDPSEKLWKLKEVEKILKKQNEFGYWTYPAGKLDIRTQENYNQIETYRQLGFLIEKYMMSRKSKGVHKACEYLLSFQTSEGDIRGIYGNQYSPNYTAGILELLIKAGYQDDRRVIRGLDWLLNIRQNDGGWAIPVRTRGLKLDVMYSSSKEKTTLPDRHKPFSHMVTGVVLRAFAIHPKYSKMEEIIDAARLMTTRFFLADKYSDRKAPIFWEKFTFPFWFTDLLSALDSLSLLGFTDQDTQIKKAIHFFIQAQDPSGLWTTLQLLKIKGPIAYQWISFVISRTLKRLVLNSKIKG